MTDDLDRMLSGGAKSAKFENPGDTVTGIVDSIVVRQKTEYGTNAPEYFPSGDPKEQIVVTVRVDNHIPDDKDDDGMRSIYIKGWGPQKRAFIDAVKAADKPAVGDRFTATFLRAEPSKQGGFPAKVFEYRIQPMQASADAQWATPAKTVDRAKVEQLRGMGMKDEAIAAALEVNVSDLGDVPF